MRQDEANNQNPIKKPGHRAGFFYAQFIVGAPAAMVTVSLKHNIDEVRKSLNSVQREILPKAISRSVNKTAKQAHVQAGRSISKVYRIKVGDAKRSLHLRARATPSHLTATIQAEGRPLPLLAFSARQTRRGVSVTIKRGKRKNVRGAFIATMKSGHKGVFARGRYERGSFKRSKQRLPITELRSVSVPGAFNQPAVMRVVEEKISTAFPRVFAHEVAFALSKLK